MQPVDQFSHPCIIDPETLKYRPFKETQRVRDFCCGAPDLDEFLNTDEVEEYDNEGLGRTMLVYRNGDLVAYFTISSEGLRIEYLRTWKSFSRMSEMRMESIPAVKIGRLAVSRAWQKKGVGRALIDHIAGMALVMGQQFGVRLLLVESKKSAEPFYIKCGFELTVPTRRQRSRANRTMFFDLAKIKDVADKE
jgi:GNAT superfamily N-acetyltransferase